MSFFNLIMVAISLCVIAAGVYYSGRDSVGGTTAYVSAFEKSVRAEWIFLGVVLFVAILVRVWDFGLVPYGMNQDGAMAAIDAKALADHATDRLGMYMPVHFTAWGYGQMSVLMSYMMIPFIKLFGLNPVTARLPMLIVSILALYVVYRLMKELTGVTGAQIALVLASFTPWHFIQSRWALDCNMFPHMFLFGVYFLYKGIRYKRRYLYLSMLFFALCMYSYGVSFYTVPFFLLAACLYLVISKRIRVRDVLICAGVYLLVAWPICLTMMINAFGWETIETPFFTMPFFPQSMRSNDILFFKDNIWDQLVNNFKYLMDVFVKGDDLPWNTVGEFGTVYMCMVPFVIVGMILVFKKIIITERKKKKKAVVPISEEERAKTAGLWLLAFWFLMAVMCGLITSNVNVNRENVLIYCLILFASFGILFVYKHRHKLIFVIAGMCLVMGISFLSAYYSAEHNEGTMSAVFMGGLGECMVDLKDSGCEQYFVDNACQYEGNQDILKLQTMFYLEVDAEFARTDAFNNQYHYVPLDETMITDEVGMGYVVPKDKAGLFDETRFDIFSHGNFVAAIAKG